METNKNFISFEERVEKGAEATNHTKQYCEYAGHKCEYVFPPILWSIAKRHKKLLSNIDLVIGDLIINDRLLIDIKRNYISLKSIQKFEGDYFFIWNSSLQNCLIFEPGYLRLLDENSIISLPSDDPGFSFEQLIKLPHKKIENFEF